MAKTQTRGVGHPDSGDNLNLEDRHKPAAPFLPATTHTLYPFFPWDPPPPSCSTGPKPTGPNDDDDDDDDDAMTSEDAPPPGPPQHKANDLPVVKRFITDHDAEGKAVFSAALPEELPRTTIYNGASFGLGYATRTTPAALGAGADVAAYAELLRSPPGIVVPGGTVARYVDVPPGSTSPMHRTVSLDYGVVLEGEVDLVLDSGATRRLRRGDLAVQRATMHAWRNPSPTEWCRMLYFLQECEPVVVAGRTLGEDYGDMAGNVKESGN